MIGYEQFSTLLGRLKQADFTNDPSLLRVAFTDLFARLADISVVKERIARRQTRQGLQLVSELNRVALTRRILLGRREDAIDKLRPFFIANGSTSNTVQRALDATRDVLKNWSPNIIDVHSNCEDQFSKSYADYVIQLSLLETDDPHGPIGAAIRNSRFNGSSARILDKPFPSGEKKIPAGFPIVLDGHTELGICSSVWVEPIPNWPEWLFNDPNVPKNCVKARKSWQDLHDAVEIVIGPMAIKSLKLNRALPDWVLLLAAQQGVKDLKSAGLGLAMQALSENAGWPIPAGVGFTGCWDDKKQLRGVTRLAEKMQAAREAGIFLLFACARPDELPQKMEKGVILAVLREGSSLDEVICRVNTICAALGLTEDRFRFIEKEMKSTWCRNSPHNESQLFPYATCPAGVVRRDAELKQLNQLILDDDSETRSRKMVVVEGGALSGKTILLGTFVKERRKIPIWFSFVRNFPAHNTSDRLLDLLARQVFARYHVLSPTSFQETVTNILANRGEIIGGLKALAQATAATIDIIVDGLNDACNKDEIRKSLKILNDLCNLPGNGFLIVGTQSIPEISSLAYPSVAIPNTSEDQIKDAMNLIDLFAHKYAENADSTIKQFASRFSIPEIQLNLAKQTKGNFWWLTFLLMECENRRDIVGVFADPNWPNLPPEIKNYISYYLDRILAECPSDVSGRIRGFIHHLSMLDTVPDPGVPVTCVLDLMNADTTSMVIDRWIGLLTNELQALLTFTQGCITFKDAVFKTYIAQDSAYLAEPIVQRLIQEIRNGRKEKALWKYAVHSAAHHIISLDRPIFAERALLFETDWMMERFISLDEADCLFADFLKEVINLRHCCKSDDQAAQGVDRAIEWFKYWGWAIEQTLFRFKGRCLPILTRWWSIVTAYIENTDGKYLLDKQIPYYNGETPVLLAPDDGYSVTNEPKEFSSTACEMQNGQIVLSSNNQLFFTEEHEPYLRAIRLLRLDVDTILKIEAVNDRDILVLGRKDEDGILLHVDSRTYKIDELHHFDNAVDFAMLGSSSAKTYRFVLVQDEYGLSTSTISIWEYTAGTVYELLGIGQQVPFRASKVLGLDENSWAILGNLDFNYQSCSDTQLSLYSLKEGKINPIPLNFEKHLENKYIINGACTLPEGRLAVVVSTGPRNLYDDRTELYVVSPDGHIKYRNKLFAGYKGTPSETSRQKADNINELTLVRDCIPLGWHNEVGIILGSTYSDIFYREFYPDLKLPPTQFDSGNMKRTAKWWFYFEGGNPRCGALNLSRQRLLIIFRRSAMIFGPRDKISEVPIQNREYEQIISSLSDGRLLVVPWQIYDCKYCSALPQCNTIHIENGRHYVKPDEDPWTDGDSIHSFGEMDNEEYDEGTMEVYRKLENTLESKIDSDPHFMMKSAGGIFAYTFRQGAQRGWSFVEIASGRTIGRNQSHTPKLLEIDHKWCLILQDESSETRLTGEVYQYRAGIDDDKITLIPELKLGPRCEIIQSTAKMVVIIDLPYLIKQDPVLNIYTYLHNEKNGNKNKWQKQSINLPQMLNAWAFYEDRRKLALVYSDHRKEIIPLDLYLNGIYFNDILPHSWNTTRSSSLRIGDNWYLIYNAEKTEPHQVLHILIDQMTLACPVKGLELSGDIQVIYQKERYLIIASMCCEQKGKYRIEIFHVRLNRHHREIFVDKDQPIKIDLDGQVACWIPIGDEHIAVAYRTGDIEVINITPTDVKPPVPCAIGFVEVVPNSLAVVNATNSNSKFLVAEGPSLKCFPLPLKW